MGKECGAWVSRRLWGGGNTSPLKTTAWEANEMSAGMVMHGKRGKCSWCLVCATQSSKRVIKIMMAENRNSINILNLYFRYT